MAAQAQVTNHAVDVQKTATNDEMVDKIHNVVLADRRLKLKEIAETRDISEERVGYILHEIFGM